jgi:hypothetical protein
MLPVVTVCDQTACGMRRHPIATTVMAIRETIGEPPMLDVYALGCCALFRVLRA